MGMQYLVLQRGVFKVKVDYPSGVSIVFPYNNVYQTILTSPMLGLIVREGSFSEVELTLLENYFINLGAPVIPTFNALDLDYGFPNLVTITEVFVDNWDTSSVTSLRGAFFNSTGLTSVHGLDNLDVSNCETFRDMFRSTKVTTLDVNSWNTSSCKNLIGFSGSNSFLSGISCANWNVTNVLTASEFLRFCTSLQTLDIGNWNLSSCGEMTTFVDGCTSLSSINVGNAFSNSPCTAYNHAFRNCTLNQKSVDDILISINTAGTSNGLLGIGGGTNATPSATGKAATDALRARGWTVTLNGY